jgi:hypothetical protein
MARFGRGGAYNRQMLGKVKKRLRRKRGARQWVGWFRKKAYGVVARLGNAYGVRAACGKVKKWSML